MDSPNTLNGHTIRASAGVYPEYVNVTKSLTIQGAQYGTDARTGRTNVNAESTVGTAAGAFNIQSPVSLTIDGFRLTGANAAGDTPAILLLGSPNNLIVNNIIEGNSRGVYFSSQNTTFRHNRLNNTADGIFGGVDNTTVEENLFTGGHPNGAVNTTVSSGDPTVNNFRIINNVSQSSGNFGVIFATVGSEISGNTIANTTGSALFVGGGNSNLAVTNNTFTGTQRQAINVNDSGFSYGNNSSISFVGNTVTRAITDADNAFSTIDYRGVAGSNRIFGNTVTLARASGTTTNPTAYGVRLRGSGSGNFDITGNVFNGGGLIANVTTNPTTSGVVLSSNQPAATPATNGGQLPATSVININCNTFSGFQNGIIAYDFVNNTTGDLVSGIDVNANGDNFLGNSLFGVNNSGTSQTIDATNSYWNSPSGPSGAGPGSGDAVSANVTFTPFLTTASTCAPMNTVPGTQTVDQDTNLTFSTGSGNAISVADLDATSGTVTLSVTNGTLTLSQTTGLTFTTGDGTADATMTFSGTLADINAALNGLVYTPTALYVGGSTLTITSSTQGSIGVGGGTQTDTDTVAINVRDAIAPTVTANPSTGQANPTNNPSISFTVDFNETVTGYNPTLASDFAVTNGTVASFTDNGDTTYTIIVTAAADGAVTGTVPANAAQDGGGNGNTASNTASVTYDGTAPVVTVNQAAGQTDPTSSSPVNFAVTINEPTTGFALNDITVGGTAGATTKVLTGSGQAYNVAVSGMTQSGTVIITIANGAVTDTAGNNSGAPVYTDNTVQFNLGNSPVVVSSANPQGWGFLTETANGTGSFVTGPATPPMGTGSARLTVDANGGEIIAKNDYSGTRFDQITQLTYSTYQNSNANTSAAIALQFDVDSDLTDNVTGYQGRLVYEPYYDPSNTVQQGAWQNWNALSPTARYWGSGSGANRPFSVACPQSNPCTRAFILQNFPDLGIRTGPTGTAGVVVFKVGGGVGSAFDGNVDKFTIGINSANTTFDFEDVPPTVSIGDVIVTEGNSGTTAAIFTVSLSQASTLPVTVSVSTADGTATGGSDYVAVSNQTVTIPAGQLSATTTVNVNGDLTDEPDETFVVNLSNAVNAGILDGQGLGTIQDDDNAPVISIVKNVPVSLNEGNSGTQTSTFTVMLSNPSSSTVTVNVTPGGTASSPGDFTLSPTSLTFAPLETTKTVTATIVGDTLVEPDETFTATLSGATNATIGTATASGTILNDDFYGQIAFSNATYNVTEGTPTVIITVTRTGGSAQPVSVFYATSNGTATAGSDYAATSGTLNWADGDIAAKTFTIPIVDDAISEAPETVNLTLSSSGGGATLGSQSTAVLTINDNDGGGFVSISGNIKQFQNPGPNTNLSGVTVNLSGSATCTATTNGSGNYSFGAPTCTMPASGNYLVTPSGLSKIYDPNSRSYTNLNINAAGADFIAYNSITDVPRKVRFGYTNVLPGNPVTVPIKLDSRGNENSVSFSFTYDTARLNTPVVTLGADATAAGANPPFVTVNTTTGTIGVLVSAPTGQSFGAAGVKEIIKVAFNTTMTTNFNTPLTFTNSPTLLQVRDTDNNPRLAQFVNGFVVFLQGKEGDVHSDANPASFNGDTDIDSGDLNLIGNWVVGNGAPDYMISNQFQRADCEPLAAPGGPGDSDVDSGDFGQVAKFILGTDPLQTAGGPAYPNPLPPGFKSIFNVNKSNSVPRVVSVSNVSGSAGNTVTVSVNLNAEAGDSAIQFSLDYDANKLGNPVVAVGNGAPGAFFFQNSATPGKITALVSYIGGGGFTAGVKQVVTIQFTIKSLATPGITPLTLNDTPTQRQVRDSNNTLVTTNYVDGSVTVSGPTAANASISGRVRSSAGKPAGGVTVILTDSNGVARRVRTSPKGLYRFDEIPTGGIYTVVASDKFTSGAPQVITLVGDLSALDLIF